MSLLRILLVTLVALAASGCQSIGTDTVTVPRVPAWQRQADDRLITSAEVAVEVRRFAPHAELRMSDRSYTLVSYDWLQAYLTWTWEAAKADGLTYTAESFDCEDFALAFSLFASRSAGRAGVKCAPLIARLTVAQNVTFANVTGAPGTLHKVIAVATDRGVYIVEPQPAAGPFRITPLAKYPNPILQVTLGD